MAIYCPELNLAYIETPRTASTATADLLINHYNGQRCGQKHSFDLPVVPDIFKISCVRNPYNSLYSAYYKCMHFKKEEPWMNPGEWPFIQKMQKENRSFKQFIFGQRKIRLGPHHLLAQNGQLDDWMYFENLQGDLDRILAKRGVQNKFKIEVLNTTHGRSKDFLSMYTPKMLLSVYKMNKKFCDFHGYYPIFI